MDRHPYVVSAIAMFLSCLAWPDVESVRAQSSRTSGDDTGSERALHLSYRTWAMRRDPASLGAGATIGDDGDRLLHQRLRVSFDRREATFRGVAELDLMTGVLLGDPASPAPREARTGTRPDAPAFSGPAQWVAPRRAYVQYLDPNHGFAKIGLQTSHWALGVVGHDGSREALQLFDDPHGGDRYVRAIAGPVISSSLHNYVVAAGADLVYRDDRASLRAGDRAGRAFFTAVVRGGWGRAGLYGVSRSQRDLDGRRLTLNTIDPFGELRWGGSDQWKYRFAAEVPLQSGSIERGGDRTEPSHSEFRGVGVATEFDATYLPADLRFELRSGIATGTADPELPGSRSFRFDPNYRVGLLLFDHYLPALSRESYRRLTDPRRAGQPPPRSVDVVQDGGVENAMYVNPTVMIGEREGWLTGIGVVGARSVDVRSDPAQTADNGGSPTGIAGRSPARRGLGWEIDAATRFRHVFSFDLAIEARTEFGILFPGPAFASSANSSAPPVSLLRGSIGADW